MSFVCADRENTKLSQFCVAQEFSDITNKEKRKKKVYLSIP